MADIPFTPHDPEWLAGPKRRVSGAALAPVPQPQAARAGEGAMRGNTAVVTGGATGIGRAVALEFARRGVNVAFNYIEIAGRDITEQALLTETALRACGVGVLSQRCDVRDQAEVERMVEKVKAELGGVHYLVNNAGITRDAAMWRLSAEQWRDVMDTNVTGAFQCTQAVARLFRTQRTGKIVNVASIQAFYPSFGVAAYASSKAALVGLTRATAIELGPSNVNVNAVAPGYVRTEALEALPEDVIERAKKNSVLGRLAEPEDVATVVVFLCSPEARHITGQVIFVDGGLSIV
ncbi:MAG TPA: 3-oxoacyl-ACP reductase family protein [Gemmatimonadales bacterium]|nr:3-oxoacyl-ACP reductase family protein [Gemmatimonadales bacterium]